MILLRPKEVSTAKISFYLAYIFSVRKNLHKHKNRMVQDLVTMVQHIFFKYDERLNCIFMFYFPQFPFHGKNDATKTNM